MKPFDLAVITARDAKQQWLFEQRLGAMELGAWARDLLVVADPPGPQPGSGGSTLYALAAALARLGIALEPGADPVAALGGRRIVLIHCGGLSQRIPQYAALGKAFAPIDREGRTVVEAVLESLAELAAGMSGGALVACGDVLYRGSPPPELPTEGAAAWAWPAPVEQASRHGVFRWDPDSGEATAALQKPAVARLRELGSRETAPLDTGVLFLSPVLLDRLLRAAGDRWRGLDLYGELVPAFVRGSGTEFTRFPWLEEVAGCGLRVFCPDNGEFLHFGTTAELLAILHRDGTRAPVLINSWVRGGEVDGGRGCVLTHCRIETRFRAAEDSFLLGLDLRHEGTQTFSHRLLFSLPVTGEEGATLDVAVGLGVEDDPKAGSSGHLMGLPLLDWAAQRRLSREDLWDEAMPEGERTLWNARLFPVGTAEDLAERLGWLQVAMGVRVGAGGWPRLSLAEVQQRFDGERWCRFEAELRGQRRG